MTNKLKFIYIIIYKLYFLIDIIKSRRILICEFIIYFIKDI